MRFSVFWALVVATFVATCTNFSSAENVAQIHDAEGDNDLKDSRNLAAVDDWWLDDAVAEERGFSGSFISKLTGRASQVKSGAIGQTKTLSDAQFKLVTKEVAASVKKNRKVWPKVKTGLKILYGSLLAALIIVSVNAMLYQK